VLKLVRPPDEWLNPTINFLGPPKNMLTSTMQKCKVNQAHFTQL